MSLLRTEQVQILFNYLHLHICLVFYLFIYVSSVDPAGSEER